MPGGPDVKGAAGRHRSHWAHTCNITRSQNQPPSPQTSLQKPCICEGSKHASAIVKGTQAVSGGGAVDVATIMHTASIDPSFLRDSIWHQS